jgi:hypothetical protein
VAHKRDLSEAVASRSQLSESVEVEEDTGSPKLAKTQVEHKKPILGSAQGTIEFKEGWDDPMTEEELAAWYVGPIFPDQSGF